MFAMLMGLTSATCTEVSTMLDQPDTVIIDVNARDRWERAHVPGAVHLDHATLCKKDLPLRRQTRLVFYCSGPMCRKAPLAARRAKALGYPNVRVMVAGIAGWLDARLPTEHA